MLAPSLKPVRRRVAVSLCVPGVDPSSPSRARRFRSLTLLGAELGPFPRCGAFSESGHRQAMRKLRGSPGHAGSRVYKARGNLLAVPPPTHVQIGLRGHDVPPLLSGSRALSPSLSPESAPDTDPRTPAHALRNGTRQATQVQRSMHAGDRRHADRDPGRTHAVEHFGGIETALSNAIAASAERKVAPCRGAMFRLQNGYGARSWRAPGPERMRASHHRRDRDGAEVATVERRRVREAEQVQLVLASGPHRAHVGMGRCAASCASTAAAATPSMRTMSSRMHTDCGATAPIRLSKGVLAGR